jgi:hypothetical protein
MLYIYIYMLYIYVIYRCVYIYLLYICYIYICYKYICYIYNICVIYIYVNSNSKPFEPVGPPTRNLIMSGPNPTVRVLQIQTWWDSGQTGWIKGHKPPVSGAPRLFCDQLRKRKSRTDEAYQLHSSGRSCKAGLYWNHPLRNLNIARVWPIKMEIYQ